MSSFEHKKLVKRNIALDIIKVLGVILITNAHSWDLWDVINRRLAVGGAQGVTLFFFVSGFAMMIGSTRTKPFIDFVLDKIKRLWPPVILWAIISSAFFEKQIDWSSFFCYSVLLLVYFLYFYILCNLLLVCK